MGDECTDAAANYKKSQQAPQTAVLPLTTEADVHQADTPEAPQDAAMANVAAVPELDRPSLPSDSTQQKTATSVADPPPGHPSAEHSEDPSGRGGPHLRLGGTEGGSKHDIPGRALTGSKRPATEVRRNNSSGTLPEGE